jgi:hypothetical protein
MHFTCKNVLSFFALPLAINAVAVAEAQDGTIVAREAQGKQVELTANC